MSNEENDFTKDSFEKEKKDENVIYGEKTYYNDKESHKYKHKSNSASTGLILILIGVLWLVSKFTDFNIFSFSALSQLWPLVFVFAGINILFKSRWSSLVWIVFILIIIFFSNIELFTFETGIPEIDKIQTKVVESVNSKTNFKFNYIGDNEMSMNYDNFLKSNKLNSEMLIIPVSKSSNDYYELSNLKKEKGNLLINLNSATINIKDGLSNNIKSTYDYVDVYEKIEDEINFYVITKEKYQNADIDSNKELNFELDKEISWDVEINAGAADGNFDFSYLQIDDIKINTGASEFEIKLPSDDFNMKINCGASSLSFESSKDLGIHLKVNGVFVDTKIDENEFYKDGSDYYSNNYDDAKYKANIEVNVAAGDIEIKTK